MKSVSEDLQRKTSNFLSHKTAFSSILRSHPAPACSLSWKCLRRHAPSMLPFLVQFQSLHTVWCAFSFQSSSGYLSNKGKLWKNQVGSRFTSSSYRYSIPWNTERKSFQFDFLCNNNKVRFIHRRPQITFFYFHFLIFLFTYPLFQPN